MQADGVHSSLIKNNFNLPLESPVLTNFYNWKNIILSETKFDLCDLDPIEEF
jgi:hypothetical protein